MNQFAELHLCITDKRDLNILKAAIQTAFTRMRFQAANPSQNDLHWCMVEAARLTSTDGSMLRLPIWITLELKPGVKTHQLVHLSAPLETPGAALRPIGRPRC